MGYSIYLSGGGSAEETFALDEIFLNTSGNRILYLPVGLKRTFAGYDGCTEWFNSVLALHKKTKQVTVFVDLKEKAEYINVDKFDAIYIGGASDTHHLHNLLVKHELYKKLTSFVESDGVIYGGSGGATILGKTINYDQLEKGLPRINAPSANLCLGYSIFTHLNTKNIDLLKSAKEGFVVGMPEGGGCMIDRDNRIMKYIGRTSGILITDGDVLPIKNQESIKI